MVADNTLNRKCDVTAPDQFWVTDITHIGPRGFAYLSVAIRLFSWRVTGRSMHRRTSTHLLLQILLIASGDANPQPSSTSTLTTVSILRVNPSSAASSVSRVWLKMKKHVFRSSIVLMAERLKAPFVGSPPSAPAPGGP